MTTNNMDHLKIVTGESPYVSLTTPTRHITLVSHTTCKSQEG